MADFGLSRTVAGDGFVETYTFGTVTHMPPELLAQGRMSKAADVYSFGGCTAAGTVGLLGENCKWCKLFWSVLAVAFPGLHHELQVDMRLQSIASESIACWGQLASLSVWQPVPAGGNVWQLIRHMV